MRAVRAVRAVLEIVVRAFLTRRLHTDLHERLRPDIARHAAAGTLAWPPPSEAAAAVSMIDHLATKHRLERPVLLWGFVTAVAMLVPLPLLPRGVLLSVLATLSSSSSAGSRHAVAAIVVAGFVLTGVTSLATYVLGRATAGVLRRDRALIEAGNPIPAPYRRWVDRYLSTYTEALRTQGWRKL